MLLHVGVPITIYVSNLHIAWGNRQADDITNKTDTLILPVVVKIINILSVLSSIGKRH